MQIFQQLGKIQRKKIRNFLARVLFSKRQRFILVVIILSLGLFVSEYILGKSAISIVFILSFLTVVFLFLTLREDLRDNFSPQVFILPFFYSLAVGLFYLLVPARMITRVGITSLYALGLYSLFLSENIFTVSSIRTIALLSGARTVSLVLTLLSFFFLSNVVFSFHINVFITLLLIFVYSFLIVLQSIWTYTLEKNPLSEIFWVLSLSFCLVEVALFLWFRQGSPTVLALFLTAIFYVLIGLTQAWFEKRLFRGIILEYFWVTAVSFIFLILFTNFG
ncbi:MAG TPA: hypothetical protein VMR59_03670 [Patescibacteria group bacterium]|jgi:hypothetical protein|nr:hypothetical protein [Patescibacteria group bacterium]